MIKELCDDPVLTLFTGSGIKDLEFEYAVIERTLFSMNENRVL